MTRVGCTLFFASFASSLPRLPSKIRCTRSGDFVALRTRLQLHALLLRGGLKGAGVEPSCPTFSARPSSFLPSLACSLYLIPCLVICALLLIPPSIAHSNSCSLVRVVSSLQADQHTPFPSPSPLTPHPTAAPPPPHTATIPRPCPRSNSRWWRRPSPSNSGSCSSLLAGWCFCFAAAASCSPWTRFSGEEAHKLNHVIFLFFLSFEKVSMLSSESLS